MDPHQFKPEYQHPPAPDSMSIPDPNPPGPDPVQACKEFADGLLGSEPEDPKLKRSSLAVAAFVFGVMSLSCFFPFGILAIIMGAAAMKRIDNPANHLRGRGAAQAGWTLGVVGCVMCVCLMVLLPALPNVRPTARKMQNSTQLRGIHQQMVVYAQSNKGWYPGLTTTGVLDGQGSTGLRNGSLGRMKREDFYTEEYLVSPQEPDPSINGTSPVIAPIGGTATGSFAILKYSNSNRLLSSPSYLGQLEWRESLRTTAIVMSDREIATGKNEPRSIWTSVEGQWQGSVLFNDNHVQFELTDKGYDGQYGRRQSDGTGTGSINNLFDLTGGNGEMTSGR